MIDAFEAGFAELLELSPQETDALFAQLSERQPAPLAYLLAATEDFLSEQESETLLFLGLAVLKALQAERGSITITDKSIDKAESRNLKHLERFSGEGALELADTVEAVFGDSSETEMLVFLAELVGNPEMGILEENRGVVFLCLKTILDAAVTRGQP